MSRKIFSIDIKDNGISALLVENSLKGNRIQEQLFVRYTNAPGTNTPGMDIKDETDNALHRISATLSKIIKEINVIGAEYIVSLAPELLSYRNLQVPFKDRKKIRQVLPFELEPTLPYPVDELTIDFLTVLQADKTDILVSVVQTTKINEILDVFKEFKITPYIVTPGGLSSVLCLSKFSETENDFLFVDIDEKYSTIFAVVSGNLHVARSFYSNFADPHLKARKISDNIIQVISAFESLFVTDFEPSKIFLSGNGTDSEVLTHELEDTLGMPTTSADMYKNINLKINISSDLPFDSVNMNNALSLAAIEILDISTINFFGERSIIKKYWEEYKNEFVKTGLVAAFVFVLAMFNILFEAHFLQKEVNLLNRQNAFIFQSTFPDETKIVNPFQQMKVNVRQELEKNMFTGEMEEEILNIDILNEISSRVPKEQDVEITNFVRGDKSLLISGNTDSFNTVDDIKGRLEEAEILENITISSANLEKSTNRIQFKLKIDL